MERVYSRKGLEEKILSKEIKMDEEDLKAQEKEHEVFVEMMGDTIGHIQPDGAVKYSKLGWIG